MHDCPPTIFPTPIIHFTIRFPKMTPTVISPSIGTCPCIVGSLPSIAYQQTTAILEPFTVDHRVLKTFVPHSITALSFTTTTLPPVLKKSLFPNPSATILQDKIIQVHSSLQLLNMPCQDLRSLICSAESLLVHVLLHLESSLPHSFQWVT